MSHPFGDAITLYLHRKHGLTMSKLAEGIDQPRSVIGLMCQGQRLTGPQARERVINIIRWLIQQQVLALLDEANTLLRAAGMADLNPSRPEEAELLQVLAKAAEPTDTATPAPVAGQPQAPSLVRPRLPHPLSSFVGRQRELAEVTHFLHLPSTRLLTLTGSGGCGKTRLALQTAQQLQPHYQDGIYWIELAALSDPDFVAQTIATELGVREKAGETLLDTIIAQLQGCKVLLVLDNCEHLVDACARLAEQLLVACPALQILATSREELRIPGETVWLVPSLSVPKLKSTLSNDTIFNAAHQSEAVQLFIERINSKQPGFMLTPQNAGIITRICSRLDGIPLALELAAARIPMLSLEQLSTRLDDRFQILTSGSRTALPRHQTLRALIAWSYDLLRPEEKLLLNRLSIFASGWSLEAAEAICAGEQIATDQVMEILQELIQKSMIEAEEQVGTIRYQMLETIRQYSGEALAELGEGDAIHDRYCRWFLALAEQAEQALQGPEQALWYGRLKREHDNVTAILVWAHNHGMGQIVARFAVSLYRVWLTWASLTEGRRWLETALSYRQQLPKELLARTLSASGMFAQVQGDHKTAYTRYQESQTLFRELGDLPRSAVNLAHMGDLAYAQSNYLTAQVLYEESLAIRRAIGEPAGIATALSALGIVSYGQGEYETARTWFEESLAIRKKLGNRQGIAHILLFLGGMALEHGDYSRARTLIEESYAIRKALGDERGTIQILIVLGRIAIGAGDLAGAQKLEEEATERSRNHADKWLLAASLNNLGRIARLQGNYTQAEAYYSESIRLRQELGNRRDIAESLTDFAALAAAHGRWQRAAHLLGAADEIRQVIGTRLPPNDLAELRALAGEVESQLDPDIWHTCLAAGKTLPVDQAVAMALDSSYTPEWNGAAEHSISEKSASGPELDTVSGLE